MSHKKLKKKGQEEIIEALFIIFIVIISLFLFVKCSINAKESSTENKINEVQNELQLRENLVKLLSSPLNYQGQERTMAQLITTWTYTDSDELEDVIRKETKKQLQQLKQLSSFDYDLFIMKPESKIVVDFLETTGQPEATHTFQVEFELPALNGMVVVTLEEKES